MGFFDSIGSSLVNSLFNSAANSLSSSLFSAGSSLFSSITSSISSGFSGLFSDKAGSISPSSLFPDIFDSDSKSAVPEASMAAPSIDVRGSSGSSFTASDRFASSFDFDDSPVKVALPSAHTVAAETPIDFSMPSLQLRQPVTDTTQFDRLFPSFSGSNTPRSGSVMYDDGAFGVCTTSDADFGILTPEQQALQSPLIDPIDLVTGAATARGIGAGAKAAYGLSGEIKAGEVGAGFINRAPRADVKLLTYEPEIGHGATSSVRQWGPNHVIKEIDARSFDRTSIALSQADKEMLAEETVRQINVIRAARPDLIPKTELAGPGFIRQQRVDGHEFNALSPAAQSRAKLEMYDAGEDARRALGMNRHYTNTDFDQGIMVAPGKLPNGWDRLVDSNKANFRFNADGSLKAWFDPIYIVPR